MSRNPEVFCHALRTVGYIPVMRSIEAPIPSDGFLGFPGWRRPLLFLVALVAIASGCGRSGGDAARSGSKDPARRPTGSASGRFVGSDGCRSCHPSEFDAWSSSRHARTLTPLGSAIRSALAGRALPAGYEVGADGGVAGPSASGPLRGTAAYAVGGKHREDLWVRMPDGRLQVFPVSLDRDAGVPLEPLSSQTDGDSSSPDSLDHWSRMGRNADLACFGCHATGSQLQYLPATPDRYAIPLSGWAEAGVGCEACHGPGGPHVDAAREGRPGASPPQGLTSTRVGAEERVAACGGCHGRRETLASPFSTTAPSISGRPVWDFADVAVRDFQDAEFRRPFLADLRPATFQQEAIALGQSLCVRKGGLTCVHCHDVHTGSLLPRADGNGACLPCHSGIVGAARAHTRHAEGAPGGRCIDCHMAPILRGPASRRSRDHSLEPPLAASKELPEACAACHDAPESRRAATEAWRTAEPRSPGTARRRILAAEDAIARRDEKAAVEGFALVAGDGNASWSLRAVCLTRIQSLIESGAAPEPAREALRRALGDVNPAVRRAAARALARCAEPADVDALTLLGSTAEDPFLALEAVSGLGSLRLPDVGTRLGRVASRSDLAGEFRAQLILGRTAVLASEWERAESALTRSLELQPFSVHGLNDLGIALMNLGRTADARRSWRYALELNPRFEAARRNLESSQVFQKP